MSRPTICVVGSSNIDLISYTPRLPKMGETLHGERFQIGFGGKGANQAVMAAKLGGAVTMITKVGDDVFGHDTLRNYSSVGIDTAHVHVTDEAFSGVASIAVDEAGNNSIIIVAGANDRLTEAEIEAARPQLTSSAVLVCQLEVPLPITLAALRMARDAGVTTIFNPAPARPDLPDEFFTLSDIFCPNETEAELLTGLPVTSVDEAVVAARRLLERGPRQVILTLGEKGSLLVTPEAVRHVAAPPVTPIDTTGAGDAFVGSLAYFLAGGMSILDAMDRANRIAALSVQRPGTQSSYPGAEDLPDGLMESH
ncbi:MAG: ribokinase [Anaerolineae bacterium]